MSATTTFILYQIVNISDDKKIKTLCRHFSINFFSQNTYTNLE